MHMENFRSINLICYIIINIKYTYTHILFYNLQHKRDVCDMSNYFYETIAPTLIRTE